LILSIKGFITRLGVLRIFMAQKRVIKDVATSGKIPREKINSVVRGVHVIPENGTWAVKKTGKTRIIEHFNSKEAAVDYARNISNTRGVAMIVHSADNLKKPAKVKEVSAVNKSSKLSGK
jgi:hypothetical protein